MNKKEHPMDTQNQNPTAAVIPTRPASSGYAAALPFAERQAILNGLNGLAGYAAVKTMLPEGTPLWDVGEQNLARERAKMNALPTLTQFNEAFLAVERAKAHKDVPFTLSGLNMRPDGKLQRLRPDGSYGPAVATTPVGLEQMVQLHREHLDLPKNFAGSLAWALKSEQPQDRADAAGLFNQMVRRAGGAGGPERVLRLARRLDTGEPYIYAVTSPKHVGAAGSFAAVVKRLTAELAKHDARVRAVHQGHDRLDLEIMFPMMAREIRVGDTLWASIGLTLSESKDASASVWDGLMRVLCANLTKAFYGAETDFSRKHTGGVNFVNDLLDRVREGSVRIAPFVRAFGDSYNDALPASAPTRAEVVTRYAKAFPEAAKVLPAESIIAAWDVDGTRSAGDSRGGLVNALTRASQTLGITDAQTIESSAGKLVAEGWGPLF